MNHVLTLHTQREGRLQPTPLKLAVRGVYSRAATLKVVAATSMAPQNPKARASPRFIIHGKSKRDSELFLPGQPNSGSARPVPGAFVWAVALKREIDHVDRTYTYHHSRPFPLDGVSGRLSGYGHGFGHGGIGVIVSFSILVVLF
jgi:hypothetical protein